MAAAAMLTGVLSAQSVSVQVEALTPLALDQVVNGNASGAVVPAGPLGTLGTVSSGSNATTGARLTWWTDSNETIERISLQHALAATAGNSASAGPHEFLVTITPTTPGAAILADLRIGRLDFSTGGAAPANVALDVGNDGTFESTNLTWFYLPLPSTGGPLELRMVFDAAVSSASSVDTTIYFDVLPTNALTILEAAVPCAQSSPPFELYAQPVFGNYGISFATSSILDPVVLLIGLSAQPVLLPTPAPVPCLLVPSPDLPLASLSGNTVGAQIDIPFSVRPATLYAQAVRLAPIGLVTSRAVRVDAQ